ncbi:MAG: ribonuclease R [Planctomycetota bacterium]|jgi:ribonuclease R
MSKGKKKKKQSDTAPEPTGDGGFKSFGALRKALGSDEEEQSQPKAKQDKGWTLERVDSDVPVDPEDAEDLLAADSRDRIAHRPDAFGPMTSGPPPYRDEDSEEMQLMQSFRVRTIFPEDVLAEVETLPEDPSEADFVGRMDLRDKVIFTIDGDDAKDYDDAISIEDLGDGQVEIGVHIADVGHYVRPETALDGEALCRGTSVYVADQVVPMLPEKLSNGLCSLVPNRPRLAYSVFMTFDEKGQRTDSRVGKSVIKSVQRNTYRIVQALLDDESTEETEAIRYLEEPLRMFEAWTRKQQQIRDAKGSLRINSRERKFVFDEKGEVLRIVDYPKYFSNTLIEETALAANQAVGDLFRTRGLPTIYRVHPEKDPEEIEAVAKMLEKHGLRVPIKDRLTGRDIGRLIRAARNRPNADALIMRIMGLVERAYYEVRDHEDVATHWGLARQAYLHFTSPIRRYPDLVVHRWLWALEERAEEAAEELNSTELVADMNDVAAHCSAQSQVAEMTEQAIGDLKICQFLEPHIGRKLDAKVQRVSRGGMEVFLPEFNVNGFLPTRVLGTHPKVEGSTLTIRQGKRNLSFSEGYGIHVVIADVDFIKLQVMLELG